MIHFLNEHLDQLLSGESIEHDGRRYRADLISMEVYASQIDFEDKEELAAYIAPDGEIWMAHSEIEINPQI